MDLLLRFYGAAGEAAVLENVTSGDALLVSRAFGAIGEAKREDLAHLIENYLLMNEDPNVNVVAVSREALTKLEDTGVRILAIVAAHTFSKKTGLHLDDGRKCMASVGAHGSRFAYDALMSAVDIALHDCPVPEVQKEMLTGAVAGLSRIVHSAGPSYFLALRNLVEFCSSVNETLSLHARMALFESNWVQSYDHDEFGRQQNFALKEDSRIREDLCLGDHFFYRALKTMLQAPTIDQTEVIRCFGALDQLTKLVESGALDNVPQQGSPADANRVIIYPQLYFEKVSYFLREASENRLYHCEPEEIASAQRLLATLDAPSVLVRPAFAPDTDFLLRPVTGKATELQHLLRVAVTKDPTDSSQT